MDLIRTVQAKVVAWLRDDHHLGIPEEQIVVTPTKKEFTGDYTVVIFPLVKLLKSNPGEVGQKLGAYLVANLSWVDHFDLKGGFVNLILSSDLWPELLAALPDKEGLGQLPFNGQTILIEFSSPNTNKPLHLGHIRNILLGWSMCNLYQALGYRVIKAQVINDRGVAICKSMLAWKKFGEGRTPDSSSQKGDHFVGDYYVLFNQKLEEEYIAWQNSQEAAQLFAQRKDTSLERPSFFKQFTNEYFNKYSVLGEEVRQMLISWEAGEQTTLELWQTMNTWVYQGFEKTYQKLGVNFDRTYYESETYLLGKKAIEGGLTKKIFVQESDGSVWIDLTDAGMDKKILLRSDGTSVYITQDLGTAQQRYFDFNFDRMVYVVGDEQEYHFKVLFEILKRLGEPWAEHLYHLAYGMVDLPSGKMKSREGTVVDADDLIGEVIQEARSAAIERGEMAEINGEEENENIRRIALSALKFFILKVNSKKRMVFDPKESLDMQGQTGPYIQNAYVRITSILRKVENTIEEIPAEGISYIVNDMERELITQLLDFDNQLKQAAEQYDPSALSNFTYALARNFHRYYHDYPILRAESIAARHFRVDLIRKIAGVLERSFEILGMQMPTKM